MIELPEAYVLANQLKQAFLGKTIVSAVANTSPHSFAWYSGDPALYHENSPEEKSRAQQSTAAILKCTWTE